MHAGIITAGLDSACGIAAFTLMPPGSDILTVEFKTNLPARQRARFAFRALVVKPGRTLMALTPREPPGSPGAKAFRVRPQVKGGIRPSEPRSPARR